MFQKVQNEDITLNVVVEGSGPLILCIHGWPELWYSWRHQLRYFADSGYTVAAMDVRGYGGSGKPSGVENYVLSKLAGDAAAVLQELSDEPAILFGHDWGAPIAYATAQQHPQLVRGVAGLSVPFRPRGEASLLQVAKQLFPEKFFYMLYFQKPSVPEQELEADVMDSLRRVYYACSGDAPLGAFLVDKDKDAGLLEGLVDPDTFPAWMSEDDLQTYAAAFKAGGFEGPINRYRAQGIDFEESAPLLGKALPTPACFIGGERDPVRRVIAGVDMFADLAGGYDDLRICEIIDGAGHWLQQEAPQECNRILARFVASL
ncbi:MAG: alpha/beta hydrolase [Pseudomonadota bacterium]